MATGLSRGQSLSEETDAIRKEMARLRFDMHRDVAGVVHEAESMFDWRSYIRNAPWVSIGAAVAVGFLLVPRRRSRRVETYIQHEAPGSSPQPLVVREAPKESSAGLNLSIWGLAGTVLSLAAPIAVRAAQSYAVSWLEENLLSGNGLNLGGGRGPGPGATTSTTATTDDPGPRPRRSF